MSTYYTVLKLNQDATSDKIKKAYKLMAKKYHPDKNRDRQEEATREFQEIGEAYKVLSNPERRANYDDSLDVNDDYDDNIPDEVEEVNEN